MIQCDTYSSNPDIFLVPPDRPDNIYSCFVQDQFTVCEDLLFLTVGSKFERDDFTGFEWEPSIRLLMTPNKQYSLWASVSRAVRIPSVGEQDVRLLSPPDTSQGFPIYPFLSGNPNLLSEEMIAYEAGVRGQTTEKLSWDLAVFSNNYDRLIIPVPGTMPEQMGNIFIFPLTVENAVKADTYGFELAANYKVNPAWQLRLSYSSLVMHVDPVPGVSNPAAEMGTAPRNLVYMQSSFDLGHHWELDLIGRYSDELALIGVPKYLVGNVRLAWHPKANLELSVVGRNLCNGKFYEFTNDNVLGTIATEVCPEVYGQVAWRLLSVRRAGLIQRWQGFRNGASIQRPARSGARRRGCRCWRPPSCWPPPRRPRSFALPPKSSRPHPPRDPKNTPSRRSSSTVSAASSSGRRRRLPTTPSPSSSPWRGKTLSVTRWMRSRPRRPSRTGTSSSAGLPPRTIIAGLVKSCS